MDQMRMGAIVLSLLSGIGIYSGCGNDENLKASSFSESAYTVHTVSVENYAVTGETRVTFDEVPHKVFAAGLEETEMVLAFAEPSSIAAVYGYYDLKDFVKPRYKETLEAAPVWQRGEVNRENVLRLRPDFLLAEQGSFTGSSLISTVFWNQRGIKTYVPANTNSPGKHEREETVEGELQYIRDMGTIFHKKELAESFIDDIEETLHFFQDRKREGTGPKALVVENFGKQIASYDQTKLAGKIISLLGGNVPETSPLLGIEDLIAEDPDILFVVCSDGDHGACMRWFLEQPAFRMLTAVKNRRVYSIELETVYAPGIRLKDGIERIGLCLYPDVREEYGDRGKDGINPSYEEWLWYQTPDDFDGL